MNTRLSTTAQAICALFLILFATGCGRSQIAAPCESSDECPTGLVCIAGTCSLGDACEDDADCAKKRDDLVEMRCGGES